MGRARLGRRGGICRDGPGGHAMSLAKVLLVALLGFGPGDDAKTLVEQLGAPRYADRAAAAERLRTLGRESLAPLRAAREAQDPEVRARALALLEEIEASLMVEPTRVRLDFRDRPIAEVARNLSEQSGITINLIPDNNPNWASRRITL